MRRAAGRVPDAVCMLHSGKLASQLMIYIIGFPMSHNKLCPACTCLTCHLAGIALPAYSSDPLKATRGNQAQLVPRWQAARRAEFT